MAMDHALLTAIENEDHFVANGISFFNLWVMATMKKDIELKEHIELEFSKLRSKYDLEAKD